MARATTTDNLLEAINNLTQGAVNPTTTIIRDGITVKHTGPFYAIYALTDAVVDVSECATGIYERSGSGTIAVQSASNGNNFTITAGLTIFGQFESIELDSGDVLLYSIPGIIPTVETD